MAFNYIKKYLAKEELEELKNKIEDIESRTSGEVRLCLKLKKGFRENKLSNKELALKEFHKLEMQKTLDKTGVLIFILFKERKFEIVADEGINAKIKDETWEAIKSHIQNEFANGKYKDGLVKCLDEIGRVLEREFPYKQGDKNELSNDIVIE
jgi:uncharacterized membrane protein